MALPEGVLPLTVSTGETLGATEGGRVRIRCCVVK